MSDRPVEAEQRFYWDAADRHRLEILRCGACGSWIHYPQPRCGRCTSTDVAPQPVSGRGTVASWTVTHYAPAPDFSEPLPFTLVMVELEEQPGLRIVTNLVDASPDELELDLPVEVTFVERDGHALPQFRPRR
jgi:uncharacterized OB-fold protein